MNMILRQTGHRLAAQSGQAIGAGRGGASGVPAQDLRHGEVGETVQSECDPQEVPDRFSAPIIARIVVAWRQRQSMVRAQQKLTLQGKDTCRGFCFGDKTDAERLYKAISGKGEHPLADYATPAVLPLLAAQQPVIEARKLYEKQLAKMAKDLPIAHMVEQIKGINHNTLAAIVGECGDLSVYEKGIAGVWKRAGLAVIEGDRQRCKSGDAALLHGYSPSRHAVFWNVGAALLKAQGKDEDAGPYRRIYDARKAYERPRVESDGHAHNRAMRYMTKRLIRDIWCEWRRVIV